MNPCLWRLQAITDACAHLSPELDGSADREAEQGAEGGVNAAADGGAEWQ